MGSWVWACSSAWLERTPDKREVGCSSQLRPTKQGSLAQLGERQICILEANGSIPLGST